VVEGQLEESGLTLGDVKLARASFIETLKGRFHVRVKYPGNEEFEMENMPAAEQIATPTEISALTGAVLVDETARLPAEVTQVEE
ncbi:MAG: hypothetical protein R6X32_23275, partial [Chloroflexota bacterium]